MRILLLGGNGLLGCALQHALRTCRVRHEFVAPSRQQLDLLDPRLVRDYFGAHRFDLVVHAAGRVGGIQANMEDPVGFLYENAVLGLNVIQAASDADIPSLLYIGSSCMYPRNHRNPLREEDLLAAPLEPTNEGYALAKIVGAKLCEYQAQQRRRNYKTLILCNLFGPHDRFEAGRSHLVASILCRLHGAKVRGAPTVEIWGDGTARREFVYVEDVADFIVDILPRLADLPNYLNVGYGRDFSVNEYYAMAREVVGYEGSFVHDARKPVGMQCKLMDSSRAAAFDWKPKTSIQAGMRKTYDFFLEHHKEA